MLDIEDLSKTIHSIQSSSTHHPRILDILDTKDLLTTDSLKFTYPGCWEQEPGGHLQQDGVASHLA